MFNISQPYSGHFFECHYIEWDRRTEDYKTPVPVSLKGYSGIGVESGVKETVRVEVTAGRWTQKDVWKVSVVATLPFKPKDKIYSPYDDKTYVIHRVSDNILHANAMANVMFKNVRNTPKVLYLGDN